MMKKSMRKRIQRRIWNRKGRQGKRRKKNSNLKNYFEKKKGKTDRNEKWIRTGTQKTMRQQQTIKQRKKNNTKIINRTKSTKQKNEKKKKQEKKN